jgi:hypothetical protein
MIDCVAIGDSIAVGYGQASHCAIHAKVGKSAHFISQHFTSGNQGSMCIISAGSNDPYSITLHKDLTTIRNSAIRCNKVIWVIPQNPHAAQIVRQVAYQFGDAVLTFQAGHDHIHPRQYKDIVGK